MKRYFFSALLVAFFCAAPVLGSDGAGVIRAGGGPSGGGSSFAGGVATSSVFMSSFPIGAIQSLAIGTGAVNPGYVVEITSDTSSDNDVAVKIQNRSTNSGADSILELLAGGTNAGSPWIHFGGTGGRDFSIGLIGSTSNKGNKFSMGFANGIATQQGLVFQKDGNTSGKAFVGVNTVTPVGRFQVAAGSSVLNEVYADSVTVYGTITSTSGIFTDSGTIKNLTVGALHGDGSGLSGISGFNPASTKTITAAWTINSTSTFILGSTFSARGTFYSATNVLPLHAYTNSDTASNVAIFENRSAGVPGGESSVIIQNNAGSYSSYTNLIFRALKSSQNWDWVIGATSQSGPVVRAFCIGPQPMSSITNPSIWINPDGNTNAAKPFVGINSKVNLSRFSVSDGSAVIQGLDARVAIGTDSASSIPSPNAIAPILYSKWSNPEGSAQLFTRDTASGTPTQLSGMFTASSVTVRSSATFLGEVNLSQMHYGSIYVTDASSALFSGTAGKWNQVSVATQSQQIYGLSYAGSSMTVNVSGYYSIGGGLSFSVGGAGIFEVGLGTGSEKIPNTCVLGTRSKREATVATNYIGGVMPEMIIWLSKGDHVCMGFRCVNQNNINFTPTAGGFTVRRVR